MVETRGIIGYVAVLQLPGNAIFNFALGAHAMAANMNERIVILEAHADYVRRDIADIKTDIGVLRTDLGMLKGEVGDLKTDLATLSVRVDHLPTKEFIVRSLAVSVTVLGGFMTLLISIAAFQDHIRALFSH